MRPAVLEVPYRTPRRSGDLLKQARQRRFTIRVDREDSGKFKTSKETKYSSLHDELDCALVRLNPILASDNLADAGTVQPRHPCQVKNENALPSGKEARNCFPKIHIADANP